MDEVGIPFEVRTLPPHAPTARAIEVKKSAKWLTDQKFPSGGLTIPFIDKRGKFTGSNCYRVDWNPASVIATVSSTIYKRIRSWVLNKNKSPKKHNYQDLLMRCAGYYAISKNNYFWDRILYLTKNIVKNRKAINSLLYSFATKLDAHKWFVYGHVCLQTKWLTSRALRPRDKSSISRRFCLPFVQHDGDAVPSQRFEYDATWSVCLALTSVSRYM